ncbi:hypothetical protein AKJ16_DCAP19982 [Drosera capensis]
MKISAPSLPTSTTFTISTRGPEPEDPARKPHIRRRGIGAAERKRSGPATPLLRWKFEEKDQRRKGKNEEEGERGKKKRRRGVGGGVSARKLGAAVWRLQCSPDVARGCGGGRDGGGGASLVELKFEVGEGGNRLSCHHEKEECDAETKDPTDSPCSVNGPINGYHCKAEPSFQCSNYAMEGATKWNPVSTKASYENSCNLHVSGSKQNPAPFVASFQSELEKARERIEELEAERKLSKKKMEHFLGKVSEERAAWRSREHEKVREYINDMKAGLNREKKSRQRLEIANSKLVNDLAEAKLSAKRYMKEYEKERKARMLIEEVCDELAKEIGEDKAEAESLKRENMKLREEVEDERKMLQMAEVWREERVQMKLVDAKLTLGEKYCQMNRIIAELENFLRSRGIPMSNSNDMREVQMLRKAAASINLHDMKELTYEPSKPDDIFSVFEEMAICEQKEREIEQCVANKTNSEIDNTHKNPKRLASLSHAGRNVVLDDDHSGWETVSQVDDQGSYRFSPDGSIPSVNNRTQRDSNVSGSCLDWEINPCDITPITEITEVPSPRGEKDSKKASSMSRLWKSGSATGDECKIVTIEEGVHAKFCNGRYSVDGVGIVSPDDGSGKVHFSLSDVDGPWTSPELNGRVGRGKKGGFIERPIGMQKSSLKQKLLEARMESQNLQLRQVLTQKI